MANRAVPPGYFDYQTRFLPQWGYSISMADTINATYDGGICVPHDCLSGAKIRNNPEPCKQFPKFNIKQRDAGPENLRPVRIELLQ